MKSKEPPPLSDADADKILKNYQGRKPLMTKKRTYQYEAALLHSNKSDDFGAVRRTAFAVLTVPCKKL